MTDSEIRYLARAVVAEMHNSEQGRQMVREMVLRTLVEQESQRKQDAVRVFLNAIATRGCHAFVNDQGILMVGPREKVGNDLGAVIHLYREAIVAHLTRHQEMERLSDERQRKEQEQAKKLVTLQDEKNTREGDTPFPATLPLPQRKAL